MAKSSQHSKMDFRKTTCTIQSDLAIGKMFYGSTTEYQYKHDVILQYKVSVLGNISYKNMSQCY